MLVQTHDVIAIESLLVSNSVQMIPTSIGYDTNALNGILLTMSGPTFHFQPVLGTHLIRPVPPTFHFQSVLGTHLPPIIYERARQGSQPLSLTCFGDSTACIYIWWLHFTRKTFTLQSRESIQKSI